MKNNDQNREKFYSYFQKECRTYIAFTSRDTFENCV